MAWAVIDDRAVVLHLTKGVYYDLSEVSTLLVRAAAACTDVEAMAAQLADRYGIPMAEATADAITGIDQLLGMDVLEES